MKQQKIGSWIAIIVGTLYFVVPLIGTFEFSLRMRRGQYSLDAYRVVLADPNFQATFAYSTVVALATSHGFSGSYAGTGHGHSASVLAGEGGAMQRDYAYHSARHAGDLDPPDAIGRQAGEGEPGRQAGPDHLLHEQVQLGLLAEARLEHAAARQPDPAAER